MKAAVLADKGVEIRDVPEPRPKPNEVLVRVRASGLNRADILIASGHRHGNLGSAGTVLGLEWAGEVVEIGADAQGIKPGDRVMCSGSGGYAEYAMADWGRAVPIPANNMTFEQAAALPIALQTMHGAVVTNERLKSGETVLIQDASAGVGSMGLQIAQHKGAKLAIGTLANEDRRRRLGEFGADLAVDSRDPSWPEEVVKATGGKGVDLIIDLLSATVANQNMKAASVLGRIIDAGRLGGFTGEFDFDLHALKRIHCIGVTFRTRSVHEVRESVRKMRADLWEAVESGQAASADRPNIPRSSTRRQRRPICAPMHISARSYSLAEFSRRSRARKGSRGKKVLTNGGVHLSVG